MVEVEVKIKIERIRCYYLTDKNVILVSETKTILLLLLFITMEPGDGGAATEAGVAPLAW